MLVELIDFDSKIPNLALMKLSAYHKSVGDSVVLSRGAQSRRMFGVPDKSYLSCVFRWNRKRALQTTEQLGGTCIIGGTGIDISSFLPSEVAEMLPDYSIYPQCDYALGFISRGCIRKCPWCVVPKKEGALQRVSTAQEIVGDRKKAIFIDNNFLALPDYGKDLEWLAENKIVIDFNQGLDARLVDDKAAHLLSRCKWLSRIRLSLDSSGMVEYVKRAIDNLADHGVSRGRISIYTLIGFHGLDDDVERLLKIREWGAEPFPQGYRDNDTGEEPATGWNRSIYNKYRRLIMRIPKSYDVWDGFRRDVVGVSPDYFAIASKRIHEASMQPPLFTVDTAQKAEQSALGM